MVAATRPKPRSRPTERRGHRNKWPPWPTSEETGQNHRGLKPCFMQQWAARPRWVDFEQLLRLAASGTRDLDHDRGWGVWALRCSLLPGPTRPAGRRVGSLVRLQIKRLQEGTTGDSAQANSSSEPTKRTPAPCAGTPTHSWALPCTGSDARGRLIFFSI